MPSRRPPLPALALLGLLAVLLAPRAARGELEREDVANNYILRIPDEWKWSEAGADWERLGIKARGFRRLERLKREGEKPTGQGGEVVLSILEAPEGRTLDQIAEDAATRQFLLGRFGEDPSKWPAVQTEKGTVGPEDASQGEPVESRLLTAEGDARNLDGELNPKSKGVLLLFVARKKLFRLRMYAWPSAFDEERLKDDITWIEINFQVIGTKEEKPKEGPRPPDEQQPAEPEEPEGDKGEEKVLENKVQRWRMVKPKGILSKEIERDAYPTTMAWFEASERDGSYQITFNVFAANAVNTQGQRYGDVDIKSWNSSRWWPDFHTNHPEGDLATFPWPKKTRNRTFVTLPDMEAGPQWIVQGDQKRPLEPDYADLERMKVVEKVKKPRLGKEEATEAYRAVLMGNRPRVGREVVMRASWKTATHSYELVVSLTGEILTAHRDRIRDLLESIEILPK